MLTAGNTPAVDIGPQRHARAFRLANKSVAAREPTIHLTGRGGSRGFAQPQSTVSHVLVVRRQYFYLWYSTSNAMELRTTRGIKRHGTKKEWTGCQRENTQNRVITHDITQQVKMQRTEGSEYFYRTISRQVDHQNNRVQKPQDGAVTEILLRNFFYFSSP